ncbi:phage tail sheath family protein [Pseudogemmobacter bohemicus]|uniref:phage tail sheath family protein n=1 Tax=Pseudogemmobacter bohemicus TaxID=2250708 RepID=UPI0018E4FD04|nr:phage tail sheath C-terminal domain-containing protein [Pseudogemmobacter bohemicus]
MLQLTYPGIYTREIPSGVRSIAGAPTSVALFVGPTKSGIDDRPTRLFSFADFERAFGGLSSESALSYSVLHFFANGGGQAWVKRVAGKGAAKASLGLKQQKKAAADPDRAMTFEALSSGGGGNALYVEIDPFGLGTNPFSTTDGALSPRFNLTILDPVNGRSERFGGLSTASNSARCAPDVLKDPDTGSKLIALSLSGNDGPAPKPNGSIYRLPASVATMVMTNELKVILGISRYAADGTADAANSIQGQEVTVFTANQARPANPADLALLLTRALNAKLAADTALFAKLGGATIQSATFEDNRLLRLTLSAPGAAPSARVHDAVISLTDPAAAANKFMAVAGISQLQTMPSRYRLGLALAGGEVTAFTAGLDSAGGQPETPVFQAAVTALEIPDPFFNLLCLPDLVRPSASDPKALHHTDAAGIYAEAARICALKHAFLLVDPPPDATSTNSAEAWKSVKFGFRSEHAGAWFPNIRVSDPLEPGAIRSHPPSGAVAGMIARTDAQTGVWQAPAGTEAGLSGTFGPALDVPDIEQGLLNPLGLNVIRKFPIFGTVAFGSRTVDGADAMASDYKYIPVRRTASYILRSLSEGLLWAVQKPNGEDLWSQLRIAATSFMHGLYRQGAFKGTSSRDAYFVACDSSTTTADDINAGIVNLVVGFAPLKPAEFVVINLRQITQATG